MRDVHVFVRCLPPPEYCLTPNEKDYPDDKRINELKVQQKEVETALEYYNA